MAERRPAKLSNVARRFLDSCPDDEAREILRLIEHVRLEPWPNGETRFVLHVPPAVFTVLQQPGHRIIYWGGGTSIYVVAIERRRPWAG